MRHKILGQIIEELKRISSENPRDFFYAIDCYADDYDDDSLRALIYQWNKTESERFDLLFPTTSKLVSELITANDGIERERNFYMGLIDLAKQSLSEIQNYNPDKHKKLKDQL